MKFRAVPALVAALAGGMGLAQAGPQPALHYAATSQVGDANAAQAWRITEIPTLGGAMATATGINDGGAVVGWSQKAGAGPRGPIHPYLYQRGRLTDLGTLNGGPDSNFNAYAAGINAGGTVVGNSNSGSTRTQAFVYSNGTMTAIGSTIESQANAISNNGYIAGSGFVPSDNPGQHAFVYRNGSLTDIGTLGGPTSIAYAVNDSGMAAGASDFDASSISHAFLYRDGAMIDLNPFEGRYSAAIGMNNLGQVVGYGASASGTYHAFLYADSRAIDLHNALGAMPNAQSLAQAINDAGEIVGVTFADGGSWSAFLYCQGNVTRLEALPAVKRAGWTQLNPVAINKNGDIAGTGTIRGNSRPFLLSRNGGR
ncbi:hypothetical protein [Noviherbaspirillum pedocola]|uniref:HAF repeat-containing protein n=1 Tax=Noviherbaspirillum pedocola TaxID=2801341 RepID=A0A934W8S5_9BURK|nr:hypothetical protein [Noviherbaspirillum pedocola]MBK4739002.1 hypothetical protein [Noviherbaspirillum pedocola]